MVYSKDRAVLKRVSSSHNAGSSSSQDTPTSSPSESSSPSNWSQPLINIRRSAIPDKQSRANGGNNTQSSSHEKKSKKTRRAVITEEEDDMDVDEASSYPSSSHTTVLSVENIHYQTQVEKVCNYFLLCANHLVPVSRANIKKCLSVDCSRKLLNDVTDMLQENYGYSVVEFVKDKFIIRKEYPSTQDESSPELPNFCFDYEDSSKLGLLWLVVCCVVMNGGFVPFQTLMAGLKSFGVDDSGHHGDLGDVKLLISKQLVKEGYLKIEKEESNVAAQTSNVDSLLNAKVSLGNRTVAMVDRKKVLDYVSRVYGNSPKDWREQYELFNQ